MKRNKMKKVISFLLLLCFLVLELSGVAEVFAAERKGNEYSSQEMAGNHYDWNDDFSNEVSKDYENVLEHKNNRDEKADMPQEDSPIFRHIDKDVFEKKNHTSRYRDEEDLNTYVFGNEDGTKTIYYMYENVKFIDENGEIKDKDISLVKKDKGYGIVENELDLYLPENPSDGIDVEYSGYTVKLIPQGGDSAVTATQDADFVVYEQYFDENSSLKYTPLLSGIKEDIILAAYAENVSYDFIVETDGLYIYNDEKGYYLADESNTKIVFYLGDVEVYDAVGKPCMGEMEVSTLEEGQRYLLTLSVDDEFLADPTTVYPVTIDPTLTISDTATGADSIMDAPIFAGYPSKNYAKYKYNTVGTTTASYGIGRTVVKLPGLTSSTEYASITASQISSVKFYVRDSSGTGKQTINLYPLKTAWTETSVTWNNVGAYVSSVNYANTLSSGKVTGFDITGLVKGWKNEIYSADAGFILINSTETNNKSFCSSEYSTTSYRPYVEMTYSATISLSRTTYSMDEGGSFTLTATTKPSGLSVTWSSGNTTVATVSSAGVVTGKKAGTAVITAKCVDADGVTHTATCTVYVCVADGVYYIQNMNSGYYLNVYGGKISNKTNVHQYTKYADTTSNTYKVRQMWKVYYLGNGRYSVRPMHKLNMGLDVTSGNVDIWNIGTTDTLASVQSYGEWTIEWNSSGYVFKNDGNSSLTMQVEDASVTLYASVVASTYAANANCRWTLSKVNTPPSGVLLYNSSSEVVVSSSYTRAVAIGQSRTISDMGLTPAVYAGSMINQTVYWTSSDADIATVNKTTGEVTGVAEGTVTITAYSAKNSSLKATYQMKVVSLFDGTYYVKNRQHGKFLQIDNNDATNDYATSGVIMEQWTYDGNDYQKWILTSLENGYYKIISVQSGLALSVKSTETSSRDVSLVQESYTGAYRQQWKITQTKNGSYKIKPRSSEGLESDLVMAVGDSLLDGSDGVNVEQRLYVDNTSYKDEWYLKHMYQATVNCYFDMGYCVRYGESKEESKEKIEGYMETVSKIYEELLGLQINYNVSYYESEIDQCKGTVTEDNIDDLCEHSENHTLRKNVMSECKSTFSSSNTITNIYWSGHKIVYYYTNEDGEEVEVRNRSVSSGSTVLVIGISDEDERDYKSKRGIFHELNHQYGAPDHYHELEDKNDKNSCKNKSICSECGTSPRAGECAMGPEKYANGKLAICDACKSEILAHLKDHHEYEEG